MIIKSSSATKRLDRRVSHILKSNTKCEFLLLFMLTETTFMIEMYYNSKIKITRYITVHYFIFNHN